MSTFKKILILSLLGIIGYGLAFLGSRIDWTWLNVLGTIIGTWFLLCCFGYLFDYNEIKSLNTSRRIILHLSRRNFETILFVFCIPAFAAFVVLVIPHLLLKAFRRRGILAFDYSFKTKSWVIKMLNPRDALSKE